MLKDLRLSRLAAACALLAAAACGGEEGGDSAAPAASRDSAAAASAGDSTSAPAAAPAAQPNAAILDSAMTPAQAAAVAQGPVQGPVNVQVLAEYELTMPRLRQLIAGARNLAQLQERRPELRDTMRIPSMDPNLLYQRLTSIPEARQAVEQTGLTAREYATGTAALIQAIMVYEMGKQGATPRGEFQYNERNVEFIAENMAEIQAMMTQAGARVPQSQPQS